MRVITALAAADPAPRLTVYSKPACVQCVATYRTLSGMGLEEGVDYVTVDLSENPETYAYVMTLGYLAAPVVTFGSESWAGYKPDLLKAAGAKILSERYGGAA